MKINIKATNLDLTPAIRVYVEKKIGELDKFVQKVGHEYKPEKGKAVYEAWVEVERTTFHHRKGNIFRAEVQIRFPGKSVRAESKQDDLHLAINEVKDELQRQLKKYIGKQATKQRKGARRFKRIIESALRSRFRRRKKE